MTVRRTLAFFAGLALIAWVYWLVLQGGFIWDDELCFHKAAWLRSESWTHYLFRDFCNWTDYFRPLSVLVLAAQVRWFDAAPQAMHLVSLALHLCNTALVWLLARQLAPKQVPQAAFAALLYGLHPALIEPVYWVGCQYEMLVTLFILLGLLANARLSGAWPRAVVVAAWFFLAACSKEAAAAFPLLLLIFDYTTSHADSLRTLIRRQWRTYLCTFIAGLVYLVARHWALGGFSHAGEPLALIDRAQKVGLAYVSYWKLLVWPMAGLGPIHPLDLARLHSGDALAACALTVAIVLGGLHALRRRRAIGSLILAVSVALLPVLHILPIAFNESLYHERYAMTALAAACALLPLALEDLPRWRIAKLAGPVLAVAWLVLSILQIRTTLPLWRDELKLWQWAALEYPDSPVAKQHLLAKYIERGDRPHARALADALMADRGSCPVCMLSIAYLALGDGDSARATAALERIRSAPALPQDPLFLQEFVVASGGLLELQNQPEAAATAYRDAMSMNPLDPQPPMSLALLLLRQGKLAQARATADIATSLLAADQREPWRETFGEAAAAAPAP
jgi:hypothetical protein